MVLLGKRVRTRETHFFFDTYIYGLLTERKKTHTEEGRDGDWWYSEASNKGNYICKGIVEKRIPLETVQYLFVPCGLGRHWVLAILNLRTNEMILLDSLYEKDRSPSLCEEIGKDYLIPFFSFLLLTRTGGSSERLKSKYNIDLDKNWTYRSMDVPRQQNEIDCGAFTCMLADFCADEHDPMKLQQQVFFGGDETIESFLNNDTTMLQANIDYFRLKIAIDILRGDLGY